MHQTDAIVSHGQAEESLQRSSHRTVTARDPDELARNLTGWHQVYDQISCGTFHGWLDEMQMPQLQVFRERISQSVHQSCRVRPNAVWLGLQVSSPRTRINGRQVNDDAVMVRPGDTGFELVTSASHEIYGVVVCRDTLERAAARAACPIDLFRLESAEVLRVHPDKRNACIRTLAALLASRHGFGTGEHCPKQGQEQALEAVLGLLDNSAVEPGAIGSLQRRQRVVAKARDYIMAHRGDVIAIPDLCEHTHVSRRTLQYCFEDVLGMSPLMYLRRFRLNGIRRDLLAGPAGPRPIGDVAAEWGFDNFSQFSCDYKKLFGESASSSVRNRTAPL